MDFFRDDTSDDDRDAGEEQSVDVDHDHNPFTGNRAALEHEEEDLAKFVAQEEIPEERIASFVEEFREEYKRDPDAVRAMLDDIYGDLAASGGHDRSGLGEERDHCTACR